MRYPGLPGDPGHRTAAAQMTGFGAVLAFEVADAPTADRLCDALAVIVHATSLGGVETLISHPATMTHASIPLDIRQRIGITDGLVRISVGIEDIEDLIADLEQALDKI